MNIQDSDQRQLAKMAEAITPQTAAATLESAYLLGWISGRTSLQQFMASFSTTHGRMPTLVELTPIPAPANPADRRSSS